MRALGAGVVFLAASLALHGVLLLALAPGPWSVSSARAEQPPMALGATPSRVATLIALWETAPPTPAKPPRQSAVPQAQTVPTLVLATNEHPQAAPRPGTLVASLIPDRAPTAQASAPRAPSSAQRAALQAALTTIWQGQLRDAITADLSQIGAGPGEAVFVIDVSPRGELLTARLQTSSGDIGFDAAALFALQTMDGLPPAPPGLLLERGRFDIPVTLAR